MSTTFTDQASRPTSAAADERQLETVFVNTLPDDYDPEVADAFASLGAEYNELASRVFDRDPVFEAPDRGIGR